MAHGSLNALPLGWPEGLARRLPLPPWVVGVAAATVLFGSYGLGGAVFAGGSGLVNADGDLFYENVLGRMVLVISVLTGYVLAASRYMVRGALTDFDALRPHLHLHCDAERADTYRRSLEAVDGARARWIGGLCFFLAPAVMASSSGTLAIFLPASWSFGTLWSLAVNGLLFWLVGRTGYLCFQQAWTFRDLAGGLADVDLLEREPFLLIGRRAMRLALFWVGAASLQAFLLANPSFLATMVSTLGLTFLTGATVFAIPVLGAHRTLLAARDAELSRLREGIRTERGVLLSAGAAERLPALLALEARVMQVPVWPFDASMRARTAFFVLLPLGSWIGGALVERLLESALR